jgi:hypothetical protein
MMARDGDAPAPSDSAVLARFPSRCPYCSRPIRPGELIVGISDAWQHDDCDEAGGENQ